MVPIALIYITAIGLVNYQGRSFQKNYGLSEQIDLLSGNSTQVFNRLTQGVQKTIQKALDDSPELFEDSVYLDSLNAELLKKYSYLIVRKGGEIIFSGSEDGKEVNFRTERWDACSLWRMWGIMCLCSGR